MADVKKTIRFEKACELIDAAHAEDPSRETVDGDSTPAELAYARRMSAWLERVAPGASEELRLAVRAQHLRRWESPREDYPMDRAGYHRWRTDLAKRQAQIAGELLESAGYGSDSIERVRSLMRKERLKRDAETQALEDVVCLVFLENSFTDFSEKHGEEKIVGILAKTWAKMSTRGQELALALELSGRGRRLLERALSGE